MNYIKHRLLLNVYKYNLCIGSLYSQLLTILRLILSQPVLKSFEVDFDFEPKKRTDCVSGNNDDYTTIINNYNLIMSLFLFFAVLKI